MAIHYFAPCLPPLLKLLPFSTDPHQLHSRAINLFNTIPSTSALTPKHRTSPAAECEEPCHHAHVPQLRNLGIPAATSTPSRCGAKPSPSSTTLPFCPRSTPCYVCVCRTQQSICLGLIVSSSPVAAAKNLRNLATEIVAAREIQFFICSPTQPSPLRQSTIYRVYSLGSKGKRFHSQKGLHLVF